MRHELRVAEEQRELSLNNSKRRGKKVRESYLLEELNIDFLINNILYIYVYNVLITGLCGFQCERILYNV